MANYFLDSSVVAGDGLSPVNAFTSLSSVPEGTDVEKSIVWVKRGDSSTLDSSISIDYLSVISWPKPSDQHYDSRPQEGIDAGWDGDPEDRPEILIPSTSKITVPSVDNGDHEYYGVDLVYTEDLATDVFNIMSSRMIFNKCRLLSPQSGVRWFSYMNGTSSKQEDNGEIRLIDTDVMNDITGVSSSVSILFWLFGVVGAKNYKKSVYIENSRVEGIKNVFYNYSNSLGSHAYTLDIFINNSVITRVNNLHFRGAFRSGGKNSFINTTIVDSEVQTSNIMIESCDMYFGSMYYLSVNNSKLSSSSYIIYANGTSGYSDSPNDIVGVEIVNSEIIATGIIGSTASGNRFSVGDISVTGTILRSMSSVFNLFDMISLGSIKLIGNTYDEVSDIVHNDNLAPTFNYISIDGQEISGKVINRSGPGEVICSNSLITGRITGDDSSDTMITIVNCDTDGVGGNPVFAKITLSRLESVGDIFTGNVGAEIYDSYLKSHTGTIGNGVVRANRTMIDVDKDLVGTVTLDSCRVNGKDVPEGKVLGSRYEMADTELSREMGGTILKVKESSISNPGVIPLNTIIDRYTAGRNSITYYAASTEGTPVEYISGTFCYVLSGKIRKIPVSAEVDGSAWSVQGSVSPVRITVDLTSLTIDDDTNIFMVPSVMMMSGVEYYFDLSSVWG